MLVKLSSKQQLKFAISQKGLTTSREGCQDSAALIFLMDDP